MQLSANRRIAVVWVFLSVVTLASWLLGSARGHQEFTPSTAITVGILAAAVIKGRLIMQHFMEVRDAPRWLRAVTDGWLVLLAGSILVLYLV